jgi:hypothetical protein
MFGTGGSFDSAQEHKHTQNDKKGGVLLSSGRSSQSKHPIRLGVINRL